MTVSPRYRYTGVIFLDGDEHSAFAQGYFSKRFQGRCAAAMVFWYLRQQASLLGRLDPEDMLFRRGPGAKKKSPKNCSPPRAPKILPGGRRRLGEGGEGGSGRAGLGLKSRGSLPFLGRRVLSGSLRWASAAVLLKAEDDGVCPGQPPWRLLVAAALVAAAAAHR